MLVCSLHILKSSYSLDFLSTSHFYISFQCASTIYVFILGGVKEAIKESISVPVGSSGTELLIMSP